MTFSEFANIVTVISGGMTIFGMSGIVTWGFFARSRNSLASVVVAVFAYSINTSIAAMLAAPVYGIWFVIHTNTVLFLNGFMAMTDLYWDRFHPLSYVVAYLVSLGFVVPLYAVLIACIYKSSFTPVGQIWRTLLGKGENR